MAKERQLDKTKRIFEVLDKWTARLEASSAKVTALEKELGETTEGTKRYKQIQETLIKEKKKEAIASTQSQNAQNRTTEAFGDSADVVGKLNKSFQKSKTGLDKLGGAFEGGAGQFNESLDIYQKSLIDRAKEGENTDVGQAILDTIAGATDNLGKIGTEDFKGPDRKARAKKRQGLVDQGAGDDDLAVFDKLATAEDVAEKTTNNIDSAVNGIGNLGKKMQGTLEQIPLIGGFLSKSMGKALGNIQKNLRKNLVKQIKAGKLSVKGLGRAFLGTIPAIGGMGTAITVATGGLSLLIGALAIAAVAMVGLALKARKFSQEANVGFSQSVKMQGSLMKASAMLIGTGQDANQIAKDMIDSFGSLDNINAANIRNVGFLATRFGAATKDIVGFQKAFGDLTGASADQANDVIRSVGNLATGAGVAAGKVIADISANMESFAKFSTMGAEGLAQAAVEAAKVGGSLSVTMKAAESLLSFESSLTAEYEAQVLTGKTLNLERARQLALEGDIGKLTTEISKQIGSVGDIGKMNAIAKQSLADAIGIQVSDLMKISRGEAAEVGETQEDLQRKTNDILTAGFQGNKDELAKLNNKPGNGDSGMYDEFTAL